MPTQTLEEVVREYMIQQGNHRRNHEVEYMVTAYEVWLELFRTTIWTMQYRILDIDKSTNTIEIPCNIERVFGISVMDECGDMRPIGYDPNMNTMTISCHSKTCSCNSCNGEGTLCDAIDSISFRTETVLINDEPYEKKIWNKKVGCSLVEVTETPAWEADGDAGEVVYVTQEKVVCEFEVNTAGCITATEANRTLIEQHCGCFIPACQQDMCYKQQNTDPPALPKNLNDYGYWKPDALCDGKWHLKDVKADKVILSYQVGATTDADGQINVPLYAKNAVKFGLKYYGLAFKQNASESAIDKAEKRWVKEKRKLFMYMNPINIYEFTRLPMRPVYW